MTPTTVSESFISWMEDNGYGTFGTDIFLNQIPDFDDDGNPINNAWWITTAGGSVTSKFVTAQAIKSYNILVSYRNSVGEVTERNLFALENQINARTSFTIDNFTVLSIGATLPQDGNRDAENRRQGSFTVALEIYKSDV